MSISPEQVKELREKTGVGILECKKALEEAAGNIEKAVEILRVKGAAKAEAKSLRTAGEGLVESYIHFGGKIGVLVELGCETDFVAKSDDFKALAKELAMQVAASAPRYVSRENVPEDTLKKEREIYRSQVLGEGKPEKIVDKIVDGKMEKFFSGACLLDQPYIREEKKKVTDLIKEKVMKLDEKIEVKRFVRFQIGE